MTDLILLFSLSALDILVNLSEKFTHRWKSMNLCLIPNIEKE